MHNRAQGTLLVAKTVNLTIHALLKTANRGLSVANAAGRLVQTHTQTGVGLAASV